MTPGIRIPIVFSIDSGFVMQATVSIYSLLRSAGESVYDIYIIVGSDFGVEDRQVIISQVNRFKNHTVRFIVHGNEFKSCTEQRGITTATYYRLLIPWLLPQYDKVIYADADIIFNLSLERVYQIDLGNNLFAMVPSIRNVYSTPNTIHYNKGVISIAKYHNAGFLLINSKLLRKENKKDELITLSRKGFEYQDQDVINIFASERIYSLSHKYCVHPLIYNMLLKNDSKLKINFGDVEDWESIKNISNVNVHYCGQSKPWKGICYAYNIWWEVYRKSVIYDPLFELAHCDSLIRERNYLLQEKKYNDEFREKFIIKAIIRMKCLWDCSFWKVKTIFTK